MLRAAGTRLDDLDVVEAHEVAWVLVLTGRAPGPFEFWKAVVEKTEQSDEAKRDRAMRRERADKALERQGWLRTRPKPHVDGHPPQAAS